MLSHRHDSRLEKALASVSWAQQMVVLDTNPASGTPWTLYTKKYPQLQVVHTQPAPTDFAAWRNQLLHHVTQPWVFFIDSDEVAIITEPAEFTALVNSTPASYSVRRIDYFLGKPLKHGEAGHMWLNRLGPEHTMRFKRVVHETTDQQATRITSLVLHHESHLSIGEFVEKVSRYATLEGQNKPLPGSLFTLYWQAILFPTGKFVLNYFLKLGFMDGWRGLVYAVMMSLHSFIVRVAWYEQHPTV
jgi:hypothetical protein